MSLKLENLTLSHGTRPVLSAFSLALEQGAQVLLLGPSGSGKTTLMHAVCGLLSPSSGSVFVGGEQMSGLPQAGRDALRRKRIGIVFQTLRLVSALSVRDNLALAQKLAGHKRDDAEIDKLLTRLGIPHCANAKPERLSQGEAQRAAIGRALAAKPQLLVADEPTSALDDDNAEAVVKLLLESAKAQGSTLLIATHDGRLKAAVPHVVHLKAIGQVA